MMKERLQEIRERALEQINSTDSLEKLNEVRVSILGKKGELTEVLKGMKDVEPKDRPMVGQIVNETRQAIEEVLENARKELSEKMREIQMKAEVIDVTLPATHVEIGSPNILEKLVEDLEDLFISMGYDVVDGPEIEVPLLFYEHKYYCPGCVEILNSSPSGYLDYDTVKMDNYSFKEYMGELSSDLISCICQPKNRSTAH